MSYYICENKDCARYGCKDIVARESFKYVSGLGLVGEKAKCPACGGIRKYVNPDADVPLSEKKVYTAKYSSASADQKRDILRQRSHEHFQKKIKEKKDFLMNKAMGEMKSLGK